VPGGTYRNAGTRVMVEELDGRLHIYSRETGKRIADHPLVISNFVPSNFRKVKPSDFRKVKPTTENL
jgi:hypothetical protein